VLCPDCSWITSNPEVIYLGFDTVETEHRGLRSLAISVHIVPDKQSLEDVTEWSRHLLWVGRETVVESELLQRER
jgi:hypothetical protein